MFRRDLAGLLRGEARTVSELARQLELAPAELRQDLVHLERSLRHGPERLEITPARCRKCGFVFSEGRVGKPGKCPACRQTWIEEPRFQVVPR